MFKINGNPTFTIAVTFEAGEEPLRLTCKRRKQTERAEAFDALTTGLNNLGEGTTKEKTERALAIQADFLAQFIESWEEADAEFSRDNLLAMLNARDGAFQKILEAYKKAGEGEAEKN